MAHIVAVFSNGIDLERALFALDEADFPYQATVIDREQELAPAPDGRAWVGIDDRDLEEDMRLLAALEIPEFLTAQYGAYIRLGDKLLIAQTDAAYMREAGEILYEANGADVAELFAWPATHKTGITKSP